MDDAITQVDALARAGALSRGEVLEVYLTMPAPWGVPQQQYADHMPDLIAYCRRNGIALHVCPASATGPTHWARVTPEQLLKLNRLLVTYRWLPPGTAPGLDRVLWHLQHGEHHGKKAEDGTTAPRGAAGAADGGRDAQMVRRGCRIRGR